MGRKIVLSLFYCLLCFPGIARASELGSVEKAVDAALSGGEPEYLEKLMKAFTDQVYKFTLEEKINTAEKQQNLYFAIVGTLSLLYQVAENVPSQWPYSLPITAARMSDWYKVQSILGSTVPELPIMFPNDAIQYIQERVHSIMYDEISDKESLNLEESSSILFRLSELFIWRYVISHPNFLRENYFRISQVPDKNFLESNPFENRKTLGEFEKRFLVRLSEIPTEHSEMPERSKYLMWFNVFKVLVIGNTISSHPPSPRRRVSKLCRDECLK